jgi:hypothetical protein
MYSIKFTRLNTNTSKVYTTKTLDQIEMYKQNMLEYLKKIESRNEKIQVVIKYHKDAAFDYEILEILTLNN